jgi:hypothetical protein
VLAGTRLCDWCRRDAEWLRRRAAEDEASAAEVGGADNAYLRTRAARRRGLADDIDGGVPQPPAAAHAPTS